MMGQWPHWPRMFYLIGGLVLLVIILGAVAMVAARRQATDTAVAQKEKPPEQTSDKAPADMVAAVNRPFNWAKDPEQTRLPSTNGSPRDDESLKQRLVALEQQQQRDAEQRKLDADELKRLREELAKKPPPAKTVDQEAQRRAQEAKEAAKQRAEALKVRRTSAMNFFTESPDGDKPEIGKRITPPYKHFLAAGSIVNCTIENGIHTDHKVPVIGRISSPVYDSVTGIEAEVLQDAVLMGSYQAVLLGDETVTVTWDKLVYHDGSETDLGGQPGGDRLGRAGLPADIDNKWGTSIFAMLTRSAQSASTVGVSMLGNSPAERVAAASVGSAVNQAGQTMQRTMNVSPTGYVAAGTPCSMTLKNALDLTAKERR